MDGWLLVGPIEDNKIEVIVQWKNVGDEYKSRNNQR